MDRSSPRPVHVVWELTLACDLKCTHCGSRAGKPRARELTTAECVEVVRRLARMGTREVTLIGGEAYLRSDWTTIISAIRRHGMQCTMQTGGRNLSNERVAAAATAGLTACGVSIDGLEVLHDRLRGVHGSFVAAFAALERLRAHHIAISVNTQITKQVLVDLPELLPLLLAAGVKNWLFQLTVPMGRAADRSEIILQPYELLSLMPLVATLADRARRHGMLVQIGNNIGYYGPYEDRLRGSGHDAVAWEGCFAGRATLGLEADGTIKGCPSLPTQSYAAGNILDVDLKRVWNEAPELTFTRQRSVEELWGFCRSCYYADVCEGGCSWMAHSLLGRRGNNPYCHHRALELEKVGLRERVVPVEAAPGCSFDHGRFEIVVEDCGGSRRVSARPDDLIQITRRGTVQGRAATRPRPLVLCRGCRRHVFAGTRSCPHCGGDCVRLEERYQRDLAVARRSATRLLNLMQDAAGLAHTVTTASRR